jgi:hypothetical protein
MRDDQPVWLVRNWRGTATGMSESELEQMSVAAGWGDEALDVSQKANSRLACATNFPVDANETRVSVKADALPKRNTSALTR